MCCLHTAYYYLFLTFTSCVLHMKQTWQRLELWTCLTNLRLVPKWVVSLSSFCTVHVHQCTCTYWYIHSWPFKISALSSLLMKSPVTTHLVLSLGHLTLLYCLLYQPLLSFFMWTFEGIEQSVINGKCWYNSVSPTVKMHEYIATKLICLASVHVYAPVIVRVFFSWFQAESLV